VLTRSVRDTAAVLDAVSGPGCGDPYTAPPPRRRFCDEVGADPGRLRVGFRSARSPGLGDTPADVVAGVEATAQTLESLGHLVEPTEIAALDHPGFGDNVPVMFPVFIARELDRWSEKLGRPLEPTVLEPWNAMLAEMGRAVPGTAYVAALEAVQGWARGVAAWWDDHDLLVTPTLSAETPPIGYLGPDVDPLEALGRMGGLTNFSMPFNVTGQPAVSLPLHHATDGMPVGIQLVAPYGREDVLLRVAAQLEAACPWRDRRPAVVAAA
jgi:amidase